jgi:hypothetical protein
MATRTVAACTVLPRCSQYLLDFVFPNPMAVDVEQARLCVNIIPNLHPPPSEICRRDAGELCYRNADSRPRFPEAGDTALRHSS